MISTSRPIRTTLLLGGLSALVWLGSAWVLGWHWSHPMLHGSAFWLMTAVYTLFLVRWSRRGRAEIIFPLVVLGLWGWYLPRAPGTLVMALVTLSWVRSGVCFPCPTGRALMREALICGGAGVLVAVLAPVSALSWALGIWLFFLVQALFFVVFEPDAERTAARVAEDPFERARRRAEELLAQE